MINYLYINNYKSFVNFRIDFDEKSLLIGTNGVGKTSILTVAFHLKTFILGNGAMVGGLFMPNSTTRWMESDIQTFEIGITEGGEEYTYRLEVKHTAQEIIQSKVLSEKLSINGEDILIVREGRGKIQNSSGVKEFFVDQTLSAIVTASYAENEKKIQGFLNAISKVIFCMPNPRLMADRVENDTYWPTADFSNFSSVYLGLSMIYPDVLEHVRDAMKLINPAFIRARINPEPFGKMFYLDYMYNGVTVPLRFSELSDGERMIFAMYTMLYGYISNGCTLLLDEPDNYLSTREIQPWCMALEEELENSGQCILISHNPEMIDYMADSDGIWLSRLASGESVVVSNPYEEAAKNNLLPYSKLIARGLVEE